MTWSRTSDVAGGSKPNSNAGSKLWRSPWFLEHLSPMAMLGYPRFRGKKTMAKQQDWKKIRWNMRVSHEIEFSSNAKSFHAFLWHPLTKGKHEPWKLRLENWVPRKHTPKSSGHDEPLMSPLKITRSWGYPSFSSTRTVPIRPFAAKIPRWLPCQRCSHPASVQARERTMQCPNQNSRLVYQRRFKSENRYVF